MTDEFTYNLTRRRVLGGLGAVGIASAGAGVGTSAFFSDEETFTNNQLVAGSLDLKVDWEEHYYDASAGAEYVLYEAPTEGDFVALPDPEKPQVWVERENLGAFMGATALEAFPDYDDDGQQDTEHEGWTYRACVDGADTERDMDPTGDFPRRTNNSDTYADETVKPLIALDDVKPGDFGELTLSFHLCDNPGYVWLTGALDEAATAENGFTEPESLVDDDDTVELLEKIETVWWYDARGDNVIQTCEEERLYLTDSVGGSETPTKLFEVAVTGGDAILTELWEDETGNFYQSDAIATSLNGEKVFVFDKDSRHLGQYRVDDDVFDDLGALSGAPGGVVLAGHAPDGTLWAASSADDQLYTIDPAGPSMMAMGDTGINLVGADLVFAADGTMYIWTAASGAEGLYKVDDPALDPTAEPVEESNIGGFDERITGLAILAGGSGHLVASDRENDAIVLIDRTDGSIVESYPMMEGGEPYSYDYGDMAAGKFCGEVFHRGTLGADLSALASGKGIPLDGNRATEFDEIGGDSAADARDPFVAGVNHFVGFAWYVPRDVGNEIQGDSVGFDLGFYTEQARHNDGSGQPPETTTQA